MSTEQQNKLSRGIIISELSPSHEERVAWYQHMQETQPVRYRPEYNLWEVFRYKDVHHVLLDHAIFALDKHVPEGFPIQLERADPLLHDDLISELLAAEENGADLTREEIIQLCFELMWAGNVTTTALLIFAIARLCRHPESYQALRDNPALIPGVVEEVMRYDYSAMNAWRVAQHNTVLAGQEIKAGQQVVAWTAAANFDETAFPHAAQFDIRRSPNPHLNFGYSIHTCPGAPLARIEARVALERIVTHFSEIRLDPENPVQYMDQMGSVRIIRSLGILFTPAGSRSHGEEMNDE